MIHHPGSLFDYEDDMVGARPVDQKLPPLIAIPTTAGTGSEVGGSSAISREDTHAKVIVWSGRLIPDLVVADPELTVDLPPAVTASASAGTSPDIRSCVPVRPGSFAALKY